MVEAYGNQFLADFGSVFHTPGTLPKAGAVDLKASPLPPALDASCWLAGSVLAGWLAGLAGWILASFGNLSN